MKVNSRSTWLLASGGGLAVLLTGLLLHRLLPTNALPVPVLATSGDGVAPLQTTAADEAHPVPSPVRKLLPEQARAEAVRQEIQLLHKECQESANGDYGRWLEQLGPFRTELQEKIRAAKPYNPTFVGSTEGRTSVLEGKEGFPLFEATPENYLAYLLCPETVNAPKVEQAIIGASRWLKQQGIDVILVPVPKMTEVYPEHFADHCPPNRIVAPHLRRILLDLSEADVEVLDPLPLFLAEGKKSSLPLYQPADPHWAPRGQALAAQAIAERLKRYEFVSRALAGPAVSKAVELPIWPISACAAYPALTPEQRQRAEKAHPSTYVGISDLADGPLESAQSPVVFIGDSYNFGLFQLVGREINLPVCSRCCAAQTTQAFKDFARNPDLLKDCKVVIWLFCDTAFQLEWPLSPNITETSELRVHK